MQVLFTFNSCCSMVRLRLLSVAFGILLLSTSCSGGELLGLGGAEQSATDTAGDDGVPEQLAAVDGYGHRLSIGLVRPPSYRPDEVVLTDQSAVIVSDLLYDGLTEATGATGQLRPGLALSWESDERFVSWWFFLDPAAGVSADDVVASLDPLTTGRGGRAGIAAVLAADIAAVDAIDDLTVAIELHGPNAGLPWVLSGIPYSIVTRAGGFTGDYEVTSDDTNGMILTRRARRSAPDGKVPAEILVTWSEPGASSEKLLKDGRVDVVVLPGDASPDIDGLETQVVVTTSAVRFYVLNSEAGSLADVESRRAVLAAVNRVELQELGADQNLAPMDGLLGSSMAGYQLNACGVVCDHDVASADAGAISNESGIGGDTGIGSDTGDRLGSLRLQITYTGDEQRATASVIARQLSAAGIDAEQSELEPEELAQAIVAGETDMFAFGWVAPSTSGDAVLPPLLAVDSPANVARIASPEVEQLLSEASVTVDDASRWALLDKAHRSALAEALILPIGGSTSVLVTAPETPSIIVRADGSIDLDSPH